MSRRSFYLLLSSLCFAGYIWITLFFAFPDFFHSGKSLCLFKTITGIPCPSCGSTRSVLTLLRGDLTGSVMLNPIGLILTTIMMTAPFWITFDLVMKKDSLYKVFRGFELLLKNRFISIPLIILVLFNWIWNIIKGV